MAEEKSKKIFYLLTSVVLLCGIVSAAAGGVVLNFKEVGRNVKCNHTSTFDGKGDMTLSD